MREEAPSYQVPSRKIVAVEHPMIIQNLDNGIKTFGTNAPFERILDSEHPEECVPLFLRFNDRMCVPILSRNTATNNILLKITVPKRTGRKRKHGSRGPYTETDPEPSTAHSFDAALEPYGLRTQARMDNPLELQRKLRDNVGKYTVEAVGEIKQTHRYRGLTDFHYSTSHSEFYSRFRDTALTGQVGNLRKFEFDLSKGVKPGGEVMPPPMLTTQSIPFNWQWHQNINIFEENDEDGEKILVNRSKPRKTDVAYLAHNVPTVPDGPEFELREDPGVEILVEELKQAMEERPLWTRRSLTNRMANSKYLYLLRAAIQFVGYQFKGGPFRDAIIKYGVDPRKDPKYRKYQTFFFKLFDADEKVHGSTWTDVRTSFTVTKGTGPKEQVNSHMFDGKTLTVDGKVWQGCDITDPLLLKLVDESPYPEKFDPNNDGWFCNGTIAKIKSIMKVKIIAIREGKHLLDSDFDVALSIPDHVPGKLSRDIRPQLPDVRLSAAQIIEQRNKGTLHVVSYAGLRQTDVMKRLKRSRIRTFVPNPKKAKLAQVGVTLPPMMMGQSQVSNSRADTPGHSFAATSSGIAKRNDGANGHVVNQEDADDNINPDDDMEIECDELGFVEADSSEQDDDLLDVPSDVEEEEQDEDESN